MVWNEKIVFRILIVSLIIIFGLTCYFVFFASEAKGIEKVLNLIGFESRENDRDNPAVPLPDDSPYVTGGLDSSSGGGSGGSSGSGLGEQGENTINLRFCTFDAYRTLTSEVPCRCGFSGVCYSVENICDATFNNGEGLCQ